MKYVVSLLVVVLASVSATEANAGLFRVKRSKCTSGNCCTKVVATKSAVQKESPVQKETAVQKEETAVQKEAVKEATQKDEKATNAVVVTEGSLLYNICLKKARIQAARGRCFHPGGSFGGCHAEGCGMGMSAQAALNNCCFTGKRRCAAAAVVKGVGGRYYACKLFW